MRAALGFVIAGTLGCSALLPFFRPVAPACPIDRVAPGDMGPDFRARYGVQVRWDEGEERLDLVVEKYGEGLVLVAFNPLGAEAFALSQTGSEVEQVRPTLPGLRVRPLDVLDAVQRLRSERGAHPDGGGADEVQRSSTEEVQRDSVDEVQRDSVDEVQRVVACDVTWNFRVIEDVWLP